MQIYKVNVKNQTFGTLYTKDGFDANDRTKIFAAEGKRALFGCTTRCSKSNPCAVYDDINAEEEDKVCEFENLNLNCFLDNGEILWEQIIHIDTIL